MKPSDFKVGDRVRIATCKEYPDYDGTVGIIYHVGEEACYIDEKHKYGRPLAFRWNDCQIELVTSAIDWQAAMISNTNALSPQSPQPQTTQQKEDTVNPYAVIYQNLVGTTPGTITSQFTTEQEAKEYAEQTIAGQRANLTQKQYFAVTIVNTKTGKLVGSVVDAPPAVDWAS